MTFLKVDITPHHIISYELIDDDTQSKLDYCIVLMIVRVCALLVNEAFWFIIRGRHRSQITRKITYQKIGYFS